MEIVLVQPTDLTPKYMTRDYWEVFDESGTGREEDLRALQIAYCKADFFKSFKEAREYVLGIAATKKYKQDMLDGLERLKKTTQTYNRAVA